MRGLFFCQIPSLPQLVIDQNENKSYRDSRDIKALRCTKPNIAEQHWLPCLGLSCQLSDKDTQGDISEKNEPNTQNKWHIRHHHLERKTRHYRPDQNCVGTGLIGSLIKEAEQEDRYDTWGDKSRVLLNSLECTLHAAQKTVSRAPERST